MEATSAFIYTRPVDDSDAEEVDSEGVAGAFSKTCLEIIASDAVDSEDPTADFLHFLVDASFPLRVQVPSLASATFDAFLDSVQSAVDALLLKVSDSDLFAITTSSSSSSSDMILTKESFFTSTGDALEDAESIWEFVVDSSSAAAEDDGFGIAGAETKVKKKKKKVRIVYFSQVRTTMRLNCPLTEFGRLFRSLE